MSVKVKIFVVDDQQAIADSLTLILNRAGHEATAFTEPEKALQASRELQPDILLSDIRMPSMSGLDLTRALRKQAPRCGLYFCAATRQLPGCSGRPSAGRTSSTSSASRSPLPSCSGT